MPREFEPKQSAHFIALENTYGAHNYHPIEVVVAHAEGVWITDVEGKKYMDLMSSYSALNQGHRHPRLVKVAHEQLDKVTLTSRAFYNDQLPLLLEQITKLVGKEAALPMNTGAEAVETAIKVARKWGYKAKGIPQDQAQIITCAGNFHGRTTTITGFSTESQYRDGFGPFAPGFKTIPYGNAEALLDAITPNTVGFLIEPIQGEAGIIVPPLGYLKAVEQICNENNVLLIADEIQTGLGRTGKMFACEHENVNPDIFILGKALSGGISPVSMVLADREIMDVFHPGDHGSTFGGNPFGAAVAREALNILVEEQLPQKAAVMGDYFMEKLKRMDSPHIKEIRGKGLFIGVEVKKESGDARLFCEKLKEAGILSKETHHTVVRFAPPLIISKSEIDFALKQIQSVFT